MVSNTKVDKHKKLTWTNALAYFAQSKGRRRRKKFYEIATWYYWTGMTRKYQARIKVTYIDKRSSLLRYGIHYDRKTFRNNERWEHSFKEHPITTSPSFGVSAPFPGMGLTHQHTYRGPVL